MIFIDILLTSTSLFGLYTKFSQTLNVSVLSTLQPQLQMSDFLQYAFHAEAEFGLAKISGAISVCSGRDGNKFTVVCEEHGLTGDSEWLSFSSVYMFSCSLASHTSPLCKGCGLLD